MGKLKFFAIRLLSLLHFVAGIAYLRYRATSTIGIFAQNSAYRAYQMAFFLLELFSFVTQILRIFENWSVTRRNCVDFKRIPSELIAPQFWHMTSSDLFSEHARYPSVDVLIPCYNEDVELVHGTILGALKIDYPPELLQVYLCDDGKDPSKRSLVEDISEKHKNLHYITRPEHKNAKAGNLNYTLERTTGDLIVTLDADFVARPNLVQRLLPYYFVWNPTLELYMFDENLAAVQAPQHYRNVSPHDTDPTDQRSTFFMEYILPAKDSFNAAPVIGTTNLINRNALKKVGFYPYHSVTEDTALSLNFHRNGYSTYYVNESLASGLAPCTLWNSFDQRERWLKGDWQILFSRSGPLTAKGLSLAQRILYFNMSMNRLLSIIHIFYDASCALLLLYKIHMLDVTNTWVFISYLIPYFALNASLRICRAVGNGGLAKSESAGLAFETIFRFVTLKGMFLVLFKGRKIRFKVTEKPNQVVKEKKIVLRERDWAKNLQRAWMNVFIAILLIVAIWHSLISTDWEETLKQSRSSLPTIMALAFTVANLLPHLLCIYLCFVPLLSCWMMEDFVHGRCDQYAIDPYTGKLYVPSSFVTMFSVLQLFVVFFSMSVLAAFTPRVSLHSSFIPAH